jgi:hypothetical protein
MMEGKCICDNVFWYRAWGSGKVHYTRPCSVDEPVPRDLMVCPVHGNNYDISKVRSVDDFYGQLPGRGDRITWKESC